MADMRQRQQQPTSSPLLLAYLDFLLTCCLSTTQVTHWPLFDFAAAAAVDVAAVVAYRPPTNQLPRRPKLSNGEGSCQLALCRPALPGALAPATGHCGVMAIRMANVAELHFSKPLDDRRAKRCRLFIKQTHSSRGHWGRTQTECFYMNHRGTFGSLTLEGALMWPLKTRQTGLPVRHSFTASVDPWQR